MKHIKEFEFPISKGDISENIYNSPMDEEVMNNNSNISLRTVLVTYEGKPMNALAIGYASGPYFMEKYYILEDIPYDSSDFEEIEEIKPEEIIKNI